MAQKFTINENLTTQLALLAAGSVCALSGPAALLGFSIFAAPMAGIAGWGLSKAVKRFNTKDPTTYKAIDRIRTDLNGRITGDARFVGMTDEARKTADTELAELIARFWPDPETFAERAADPSGFPKAVADHVLEEMNGSAFSSGLFMDDPAAAYARAVIEGALAAALSDRDYFETLEPHLMMKTLGLTGQVGRDVTAMSHRLSNLEVNLGEGFAKVEAKIDGVKRDTEEILAAIKAGQAATPEEDRAARQTIAEMLTSGRRASIDAVRELMGESPNPAAATSRLKQAIAEQSDARRSATRNEVQLLEEVATINYFTNGPEAAEALSRVASLAPDDAEVWNRLGNLQHRLGELGAALDAFCQVERIADAQDNSELRATAYGNMGIVAQTRGDLNEAMRFYEQSLALNEELGRKEGMAIQYGNMGIVARTRGDLDEAMRFYEQSLAIEKELGRKEGMASDYGNMGNVAQTRGDLDGAMRFYEQSLALNEELGRKEGMAIQYGNMGIVAQTRGDLDGAMRFYEQSLALNDALL